MARYIDAEKAEKDGWSASRIYPQDAHTMVYETKKMTDFLTADVAEIVRCKNCRWGKEACGNIECNVDLNVPSEYHGYDWFCPNGERRDDVEITKRTD